MDILNSLAALIPPPWNALVLIAAPILLHYLGAIKIPGPKPANPPTPPVVPGPIDPTPIVPNQPPLILPTRPHLSKLLSLLDTLLAVKPGELGPGEKGIVKLALTELDQK
jgi:hypothetical protein